MPWWIRDPARIAREERRQHRLRALRYNLYHDEINYNPYRRKRTTGLRVHSGRTDLESPTAQGSSWDLVQLAVEEARKAEQNYLKDHGQHTQGIQSDGQHQWSPANTPRGIRLQFLKERRTFKPSDEENLEKVLHNSIKDNKHLAAQPGLTGLARLAHSFGLAINRDIKAPLAAIGVSSIINGPLVKVARKERISILRYGRGSNLDDCNIVKCRSGA